MGIENRVVKVRPGWTSHARPIADALPTRPPHVTLRTQRPHITRLARPPLATATI